MAGCTVPLRPLRKLEAQIRAHVCTLEKSAGNTNKCSYYPHFALDYYRGARMGQLPLEGNWYERKRCYFVIGVVDRGYRTRSVYRPNEIAAPA